MLPNGWQSCSSSAVQAYRYLPTDGVLRIVFDQGRMVYDYPCTSDMFQRFTSVTSKGRFLNQVLKPYARQRGWSRPAYPWTSW